VQFTQGLIKVIYNKKHPALFFYSDYIAQMINENSNLKKCGRHVSLISNNMSACAWNNSVKITKTYQIMLHLDEHGNLEALKYKTFTLTIQL